jgi:hypothetical protein
VEYHELGTKSKPTREVEKGTQWSPYSKGKKSFVLFKKEFREGSKNNRKYKFNCLIHGVNSSHATDECKVLKAQAEKMQKQSDSFKKYGVGRKPSKENNLHEAFATMQQELTSLKEVLKNSNKKRKEPEKGKESNFNIEEFEKLSIEEKEDEE